MTRRVLAASPHRSLQEAREWVAANVHSTEGVICPCCSQPDQVHRRHVSSATVARLVDLYFYSREHGPGFHHVSDFVTDHTVGRDIAILRFIDLLEREPGPTDSGNYRITERGCGFVEGRLAVPQVLVIYHDELIQALGPNRVITGLWQGFRYREYSDRYNG